MVLTESLDLSSTGGHEAQFPMRRVFPVRFILRHYPVRSQAHGLRKVFEERKPRFSEGERRRGWHVQYDAIGPGHQFLRDPKTLRIYDPEEVRVHLQIHHRELENLNAGAEVHDQFSFLEMIESHGFKYSQKKGGCWFRGISVLPPYRVE